MQRNIMPKASLLANATIRALATCHGDGPDVGPDGVEDIAKFAHGWSRQISEVAAALPI